MSDGVKFVFKTLFKVPVIILAAYLLMNILGLATTFFRVQGVQYGLENVVTENNYISRADLTKLCLRYGPSAIQRMTPASGGR